MAKSGWERKKNAPRYTPEFERKSVYTVEEMKEIGVMTAAMTQADLQERNTIANEKVAKTLSSLSKKPAPKMGVTALEQARYRQTLERHVGYGAQYGKGEYFPGASNADKLLIQKDAITNQIALEKRNPELYANYKQALVGRIEATRTAGEAYFAAPPLQRFNAKAGYYGGMAGKGVGIGAGAGGIIGGADYMMQNFMPDPTMTQQERSAASLQSGISQGAFFGGYAIGSKLTAGMTGAGAAFGPWIFAGAFASIVGGAIARVVKESLGSIGRAKEGYSSAMEPLARAGVFQTMSEESRMIIAKGHVASAERVKLMHRKEAIDINEARVEMGLSTATGVALTRIIGTGGLAAGGALIGQTLIPIPIVGALIGGGIGAFIGKTASDAVLE